VLANKVLTQRNVLLLSVGLRGARIDDLLPALALGLALYTVSTLAQSLPYIFSYPTVEDDERSESSGEEGAYGEIHHARLSGLLNILTLRYFGIGVELSHEASVLLLCGVSLAPPCLLVRAVLRQTYVEQIVV
jgi:hypothetical protein